LRHKRHLGIHSELFSDGVIDLVEAGVIDGEAKTLHRGKLVAGFVLGTRRLFEWVHNNAMVELHPTEYVNDPFVIAQHRRMVAINSALQVDLSGQVCADSIGPRLYSGFAISNSLSEKAVLRLDEGRKTNDEGRRCHLSSLVLLLSYRARAAM
jgi:acetyl-CoA hydrolase